MSLSNWQSRWAQQMHTVQEIHLVISGCSYMKQWKPMCYRSWSLPTSTTWPHFALNRPTKEPIYARCPTAVTMMTLLLTRTAGLRTAWVCSHANFNALDIETRQTLGRHGDYWCALSSSRCDVGIWEKLCLEFSYWYALLWNKWRQHINIEKRWNF